MSRSEATEEKILGKLLAALWYINRTQGSVVCLMGFTSTRLGLDDLEGLF